MDIVLFAIGGLLFVAHLFTALFHKTRIPDVLWLMLVGIVAGPLLGLVMPGDFGKVGGVFTTVALVMILFEGGVTLETPTVLRSARDTVLLSIVTMAVTVLLTAAIVVFFFQTTWLIGLLAGVILGGTSSAVVVPIVHMLKLREPAGTVLVLESALTDVLTIVLTYGILTAMVSEHVQVGKLLGEILSAFLVSGIIGVVAGHAWLFVLDRVRHLPNTFFTTFASLFLLYGFVEMIGLSGPIASLMFGMTLTNFRYFGFHRLPGLRDIQWSRLSETDRMFQREFIFLVKLFFFVYLGISMKMDGSHARYIPILLTIAIFVARWLVTRVVASRQIPPYERSIMSVMVPKGLAAAVLAGLPFVYGIPEAGLVQEIVYQVIFISIFFAAVLVPLISRRARAHGSASIAMDSSGAET